MNKPTDYPVHAKHIESVSDAQNADITYAQLKDRVEAKLLITDEMIRNARAKLDAAYIETNDADNELNKFKLSQIRDRFKIE